MNARAVIAGVGLTDVGKVYGRSATDFAADAVRRSAADAGLHLNDIDGLLVSSGLRRDVGVSLAKVLGMRELRLLVEMNALGSSAGAMVSYAAAMVSSGAAEAVACVFADAPLRQRESSGQAYASSAAFLRGLSGYRVTTGAVSPNVLYALAAQRHMQEFGTTSEQLGAIAVAQRQWAGMNPMAQMQASITLEDHQSSRMIAEPLHLLDCCLVSNGGAAVVVTTAERARDLPRPPVHIWGWGQGHPGENMGRGGTFGLRTGAAIAGPTAMRMAGVTVDDVDLIEIYDCYTYTVLVTVEDYGFCAKGEGGAFFAEGRTAPGGPLPCNTGGGQLSSYYLWGMTPLLEGVVQARGEARERQVERRDVVLVSGNGGVLDHHSTLVLSPLPKDGR